MKSVRLIILSCIIGLVPLSVAAQVPGDAVPRKKIGLVLGGGGAKGGAEVGALKALEAAGIHVDYIAGTSIGAVVGCLYAAGYTADELDAMFCQQEWLSLLTDRREDLGGEPLKTINGVTYIFGFPVIDLSNSSFGVLGGTRVEHVLDSMLAAKNAVEFQQMKIPFRCVAAEMLTASEVVISQGTVSQAVKASMAIPGLFKPVNIDGRNLIDGGMMNNLPVDVVRDMGADYVIAIDLQQSRQETKEDNEVDSFLSAIGDLVGLGDVLNWVVSRPDIRKRNENRQMADVYINPPLPDYEASSFGNKNMRRMIDIGEQATREALQKALSVKNGQ